MSYIFHVKTVDLRILVIRCLVLSKWFSVAIMIVLVICFKWIKTDYVTCSVFTIIELPNYHYPLKKLNTVLDILISTEF